MCVYGHSFKYKTENNLIVVNKRIVYICHVDIGPGTMSMLIHLCISRRTLALCIICLHAILYMIQITEIAREHPQFITNVHKEFHIWHFSWI